MIKTYPRITFGLYGLSIKQDGSASFNDDHEWSKPADILTGNVASKPFATFEPDYWLLDGSYKIAPSDANLVRTGLISESMSDGDGAFADLPVLTITFGSIHDMSGLTLRFAAASNDFASSIAVAYYDSFNAIIRSDAYNLTSWEISTGQDVAGCKKIIITFNATNKPYRRLRVTGIDFGTLIYFERGDIKDARVIQEVNPLSVELPIDTLDLTVFSDDSDFSIVNPSGSFAALQNRQPLDVYEYVNNSPVYIGQFYLNTWEAVSENVTKFTAVDRIGVLDSETYYGGIYNAVDSDTLIDQILSEVNTPYELDQNLFNIPISGWLPICTYRKAIQQIAFVLGAYVTSSRAGVLKIYQTTLAQDLSEHEYTLTKAQKGIDQSLTLKTMVTGVEVTAHTFTEEEPVYADEGDTITNEKIMFSGTLSVGTRTIEFSEPIHSVYISIGSNVSITKVGANYVVVSKTISSGWVEIKGFGYIDSKQVSSIYMAGLDASAPTNVLKITDATLVTPSNVSTIASRVYDYYQQRYLQKVKLYVPDVVPAGSVKVDTYQNKRLGGVVEKMELDLVHGFTSQTAITGVILP